MENIIKTFTGFFFIMLTVFLATGVMGSSIESRNATQYAANCAQRIESSNFSKNVIQTINQESEERGYHITVNTVTSPTNRYVHYGTLTLEYQYTIPILGIDQTHDVVMDLH